MKITSKRHLNIPRWVLILFTAFTVLNLHSADLPEPVRWTNSHAYELVLFDTNCPDRSWLTAFEAASTRQFTGMRGHLATITSSEENAFIASSFNTFRDQTFAWIGGRSVSNDMRWKWVAGLENDILFSISNTPTPPFYFANWGGIEPNITHTNEDYVNFNVGSNSFGIAHGQWGNAQSPPAANEPVVGFLVEYEPKFEPVPPGSLDDSILAIRCSEIQLCFDSKSNRRYQLQFKCGIGLDCWTDLGLPIFGTGTRICTNFSLHAGDPPRFYRVRASD